jgi:hypothetical protein
MAGRFFGAAQGAKSVHLPKTKIRKSIQADLIIQASDEDIPLAPTGKSVVPLRASRAQSRGAFRDRHERLARDAMDADDAAGRAASSRTAKSCGPGIATLMPSFVTMLAHRTR